MEKICTSLPCVSATGRRWLRVTRGRQRRRANSESWLLLQTLTANSGTLGLPISIPGRASYRHLFEDSAAILFLRNDSLQFREVGELGAQPENAINDHCRASCVDWYGNARPLFLRGRVFALLGYEIVEGTLDDGRMKELRRVNAPGRGKLESRQIRSAIFGLLFGKLPSLRAVFALKIRRQFTFQEANPMLRRRQSFIVPFLLLALALATAAQTARRPIKSKTSAAFVT